MSSGHPENKYFMECQEFTVILGGTLVVYTSGSPSGQGMIMTEAEPSVRSVLQSRFFFSYCPVLYRRSTRSIRSQTLLP